MSTHTHTQMYTTLAFCIRPFSLETETKAVSCSPFYVLLPSCEKLFPFSNGIGISEAAGFVGGKLVRSFLLLLCNFCKSSFVFPREFKLISKTYTHTPTYM